MVNLREARRLLAGTKKPEKPVEKPKIDLKTAVAAVGAGRPVLNSMVQAQAGERLRAVMDDWVLNGGSLGQPGVPDLTAEGVEVSHPGGVGALEFFRNVVTGRRSAADPATATMPRLGNVELRDWNQLLGEPSVMEQMRQMQLHEITHRPIIQQIADRNISFDLAEPGSERTVVRVHTTSPLARAMETVRDRAEETATEVQLRQAGRLARLANQFATKSEAALRREGITVSTHGVRPRDMVPSATDVDRLFRREGGPDHVEEIIAMLFWGYGTHRICMMECRMDVESNHRGIDTSAALLAFKVRDTQDFGIQPFCGSQNYNETVGFFIYQAQQGRRL